MVNIFLVRWWHSRCFTIVMYVNIVYDNNGDKDDFWLNRWQLK
jgi:hypothetical protein